MGVAREKQGVADKSRVGGKKAAKRGRAKLSEAADKALKENSGPITQSLLNSTLSGHVQSARLLLELAGKPPESKEKEKRRGRSWAKTMASEPEWNAESNNAEAEANVEQQKANE